MKYEDRQIPKSLGVILTILLFFGTLTITRAQTIEQIAEKALAATVYLEMQDSIGETLSIGSGFFVRQDLIVTNYHVIEGAARGTAKLVGKHTKYTIEGVATTNTYNDLVLLKIPASGVKPLPLVENSDRVKIGARVYVAGNPKGLEGTFSDGIISSKRGGPAKGCLQMTAPISPGSSGGPVLNTRGEVIGVSFMTIEGGQNLNFAIPSNYIKTLLAISNRVRPLSRVSSTVSAETYFRRGYMKYESGDYQGALAAFDSTIQLRPDAAEAYVNRGNVKGKLGQLNAAIADYDTAIRLRPDLVDAYVNRGAAKADLGQLNAAIADYDTAIRLRPDDAEAYVNQGSAKYKLGQFNAAISDYDTAIRLKPEYAEAYYDRGLVKRKLGQFNAAIADYDTAIRLKPEYAEAYLGRGLAKRKLGQFNAAIADYDTAIRLKPEYAEAYLGRGLAKDALGQSNVAIADFDTAIRLKPNYAEAYANRGSAKGKLGQFNAAISDFDTAIRLKPDLAEAYANRGVTKASLNRTWEAKRDLQTALRLAEKAGNARLKASIQEILRMLE